MEPTSEETLNLIKELEEKHADRGLKFTSPFEGYIPIQAYGYLDGVRFYFRSRNGKNSILQGHFNRLNESVGMLSYYPAEAYPNENTVKVTTETVAPLYIVFTDLINKLPPYPKTWAFTDQELDTAGNNYTHQVKLMETLHDKWLTSGLTLENAAEHFGITQEEFLEAVQGGRDLTFTELRMLGNYLGCEISYNVDKKN